MDELHLAKAGNRIYFRRHWSFTANGNINDYQYYDSGSVQHCKPVCFYRYWSYPGTENRQKRIKVIDQDKDLIIQAKLGNDKAFAEIVGKYRDLAFTFAKTVVKDSQLAEDVVQESFIRVYFNLGSFKGESKFKTWLYRIVINEAFRQYKHYKRFISDEPAGSGTETDNDTPLTLLHKKEQSLIINRALEMIKPKEALVLRMFYLESLSIKEISFATRWSVSKVKVVLHRGRKNIRPLLERNSLNP